MSKNLGPPRFTVETLVSAFNQLPGKPGGRFDNDLSLRQRRERGWIGRIIGPPAGRRERNRLDAILDGARLDDGHDEV